MTILCGLLCCLFTGCGSEPKAVEKAAAIPTFPKPTDESRRFPKASLKSAVIVDNHAMGHSFLPGGNVATYSRAGKEYRLFLVKLPDPTQAGIALLDYKNVLKDARFVASFGGYFGNDNGMPVFVFSKNEWLLGIAGLDMKDADPVAREFAGRI
ncbi:MAG: hypothetical protein SFV51_21235 [Bryobacteraceae bacterium]|nr:hypothetical protein [Bryobacteraceae bacterium]